MKNLLLIPLFLFISTSIFSQTDLVFLKDYKILKVSVTKVGTSKIEYKYENEALINEVSISKIQRIEFKSGRIQEFNTKETTTNVQKLQEQKKENRFVPPPMNSELIAIIPFYFYDAYSRQTFGGKKSLEVQRKIFRDLQDNGIQNIQSINNTNAYLKQASIDYTKIEEYPIQELQTALGVGSIIFGGFKILDNEEVTHVEHGGTVTEKYVGTDVYEDEETGDLVVEDVYIESYEPGFVETIVWKDKQFIGHISISKNGNIIHTDERDPFFQTGDEDGWMEPLEKLLKKSPFDIRY